MSISHSLEFESERTTADVLQKLLSSDVGLKKIAENKVRAERLLGRVAAISPISQRGLYNDFRVRADLRVTFDETFETDTEKVVEVLGKAAASLLEQETGDLIFFWVVDTPILKRTNGTLKVIDEPEFEWLRTALTNANLNYEMQPEQGIRQVEQ